MSIASAPGTMLASWIAARSVHRPAVVAQMPLPTFASTTSAVLSTVYSAARVTAGAVAISTQTASSTNTPRVIAVLASMDPPLIADFGRAANPRAVSPRPTTPDHGIELLPLLNREGRHADNRRFGPSCVQPSERPRAGAPRRRGRGGRPRAAGTFASSPDEPRRAANLICC